MSEKRRGRHHNLEEEKPTKVEYAVAKYLRFGLPVKEGKLHGMEVKCFIASAAVDKLLESNWSSAKNKKDPLFTNRASCVVYLDILLQKGLFHRADRDRRKKEKEKDAGKRKKKEKEKDKEEQAQEEGVKQRKSKKDKKSKKEEEANEETEAKDEADKKTEKKEEKKKKEKRLKLLMSEEQWFEDGDEVYVWIYDPVNAKTFIIGLLMVFGAIGLCMFPLWPEEVRIGVYYMSLAAAGFVGFILFLVVVRLILFCLVWVMTFGRHHFWFLPNLTEDVGFFESFRPLYKHDVVSWKEEAADSGGKKKKKSKMGEESATQESQIKAEDVLDYQEFLSDVMPSAGKLMDALHSDRIQKTKDFSTTEKKEKSSDKDDSDEFEVIKKEELDDNKASREKDEEEGERDDEDEMADENNGEEDEDMEENDDQYGDDEDEDADDINGDDSEETENNEPKKTK